MNRITRDHAIRNLLARNIQPAVLAETYNLPVARIEQIGKNLPLRHVQKSQNIQAVYAFILQYMTSHHGLPPSIREIMQGASISSTSMVVYYLRKLAEEKKLVFTDFGGARNFYLPGSTWTPPSL